MTLQVQTADLPIWSDPLDRFLAGQLSVATQKAYGADLRAFFGTNNVTMDNVVAVTFHDVVAYRNTLSSAGYKRTTINRKLASVKAFFRMVTAAGLVDRNPADPALVRGYRIEAPMSGKSIPDEALKSIKATIEEEANELVKDRDLALIHILIYGGLRRSEVSMMNWEHIKPEGAFYILSLPITKSGVPQDIKLQPIVLHYLEQYARSLEARGYQRTGHVFLSLSVNHSRGKRLTPQSINTIVQRCALRARIPQHVTAHMFRHTCCTLAIEGGAKPQQVQAHLRHKDLKTTMRYYENRDRLTDNAGDYIKTDALSTTTG